MYAACESLSLFPCVSRRLLSRSMPSVPYGLCDRDQIVVLSENRRKYEIWEKLRGKLWTALWRLHLGAGKAE